MFFEDGQTRLFPNGTVVYQNGTSSEGVVFWGAMDPRNPRSITSLKTYLMDTIRDDDEVDLDLMMTLDNQRLARGDREGKETNVSHRAEVNTNVQTKAPDDKHNDYISEIAGNILDTLEDLVGAGTALETCSESLACRAKTFLPTLPSTWPLPSKTRCQQLKKRNSTVCTN